MKSPGKMLARLIPQRRAAVTPESLAENIEEQQTPSAPLHSTEATRGSRTDESGSAAEREIDAARAASVPVDVEAVPAPDDGSRSKAEATALPLESEASKKPPATLPTKKLGRAKRTRADTVAQSATVGKTGRPAQSSPSRPAFFDEVASLDEDIKELRIQLAQKLHLQNVQLKKMLERFDLS